MNLLRLLFRRKINAIHKSTRELPIYAHTSLAELKAQVEAEGWAYPSPTTLNHLWQKFKLWAWQRRQIKKSPRPLPHMQQVNAGHWVEQPIGKPGRDTPWLADKGDSTIPSITTDLHYWKTHEPIILKLGEGVEDTVDLVSGKPLDDVWPARRKAQAESHSGLEDRVE